MTDSTPSPSSAGQPAPSAGRGLRTLGIVALVLLAGTFLVRRGSKATVPDLSGRELVWFRSASSGHVDLGSPIEAVRGHWILIEGKAEQPSRWLNLESFDSFAVR